MLAQALERYRASPEDAQADDLQGLLGDWFHVDPVFEPLRDDPAFQDVVRSRDDDWQPPGAVRDQILMALIVAALLGAVVVWFLGRSGLSKAMPSI